MPLPAWGLGFDEELGKRDDDLKPRRRSTMRSSASSPLWTAPFRFRRKRILFVALVLAFIYVMFWIASQITPVDEGQAPMAPFRLRDMLPSGPATGSTERPPEKDGDPRLTRRYYNGPIQYPKLAITLYAASRTMGHGSENRNVLFAAANLKSVAALIPLACEMSRWQRNKVHFVLMGRDEATVNDILEVNGVQVQCSVAWHDARPNFASYSSDIRMHVSVSAGLGHTHSFLHPQVLLLDSSEQEDTVFVKAMREKARELSIPMIDLPQNALENMMWITRLDSGSLSAWNKADVDILVHAPQWSSGGLLRLLKSLKQADYPSSSAPRLTVELPPIVDGPTRRYLKDLKPSSNDNRDKVNHITLRHRIRPLSNSDEESSVQFLESFFPTIPSDSHVLILSSQGELSPLFFHYVKYALLEYKYSSYGSKTRDRLLGISLELPYTHLDGSTAFFPPSNARLPGLAGQNSTSFLWQAPNSNAALYFGDKWVELHDFIRRRLEAQRSLQNPPITRLMDKKLPYWMEYLLELARIRGYYLFYPRLDSENVIATIHHELSREEATSDADIQKGTTGDAQTPGYLAASSIKESVLTSQNSLLSILPAEGDLPELEDMPVLSYDGKPTSLNGMDAELMASKFRREIGDCEDTGTKKQKEQSAADLFCLDDDDEEEEEEQEEEKDEQAKDENVVDMSPLQAKRS